MAQLTASTINSNGKNIAQFSAPPANLIITGYSSNLLFYNVPHCKSWYIKIVKQYCNRFFKLVYTKFIKP